MLNLPNQQNTPDDIGLKAEIKDLGAYIKGRYQSRVAAKTSPELSVV